MKRTIFIILTSTLFILILLYFYDKREFILNKQLKENNQFYIEYPYFHKTEIDSYLEQYLNNYISKKNIDHTLFIDYDYYEKDPDQIDLIMYTHEEKGVLVQENQKHFVININTGKILEKETLCPISKNDDIQKGQKIDSKKPMIALTFDDGPNHNTNKVLNILEKYGVKATFFILGSNISGNEKTIARMKELGMEIGNHMYSHKLVTKLKNDQVKEEIQKVDDLIYSITQEYPTLIRPSYGSYNKRIKSLIDRPIITWNIDTLDWKYHNSKKIYQRVMKDISDGDIILMHDIYNATANSLERIIPQLLKDGYQFTTVSELLYYKGKNPQNGEVYSHAS